MVNGLDASTQRFLIALEKINQRAVRAQQQISSGKKITSASDAPDQVSPLLMARASLEQTKQINTNLGLAKSEVDSAEQALSSAVDVLQRVNELGVQGANSTVSPAQRSTIAIEVTSALEHLVAVSATAVQGRYVFSGDSYSDMPYTLDLAQPNGVSAYGGGLATRQIQHPSGTRFTISKSADEIFDDTADGASVFGAVNQLRLALENGPTVPLGDPDYATQYQAQTDAIGAALTSIRAAQDHLNNELSYYGTVQNRISEAINIGSKLAMRQTAALSEIQDTDLPTAATELSLATTHRDAALSSRALMGSRSLFDYLG
jgi:flagellar hook-associated protein 3 FlgL